MLIHQAETLADLQGASFAQLITALQTRFDHPELAMFVVDGEQVGVRVGGVVQPLIGARQPLGAAAELPRPAAGVRVVETTLTQRPAPAAVPAPQQGSAPPPTRGAALAWASNRRCSRGSAGSRRPATGRPTRRGAACSARPGDKP
jgi:hypothetical protein